MAKRPPSSPPFQIKNIVPVPYYEAYTIRPDDLASSEERWSLPPKKSIPATQEDLHTEVIRQRQSDRTACRELEDCHGPKRQYIDRLISERDSSTSLGHFEVAQLRLERIPRESGKAFNRNSGRNNHARDYKQRDFAKPRQKTVYMHIILQFMNYPKRSLAQIPPDNFAPRNPNVGNGYRSGGEPTLEDDVLIPLISSYDQPSVILETSQRPTQPRGYPYTPADEQIVWPPSSRYVSRGTQTNFPVHATPPGDWSSADTTEDAMLGDTLTEETWTAANDVEQEMPRTSPCSDDEVVSIGNSVVAFESTVESSEEESRGINDYEKPPWFQNLQPGLLFLKLSISNADTDVFYQQNGGEASTAPAEQDPDDASEKDDDEVSEAHAEEDTDFAETDISSWSRDEIDQRPPDNTEHDDDHFPDYAENESTPIVTEVRKLESIDEHPINGPTNIPMSEYHSNVRGPPPLEKLPPSERYKPRLPLNPLPARPSLTRAFATYDSRSTDDSERKSLKRVSFQQTSTPLCTPPSTCTSSPVSPSASPQMPFRTILAKPPPVSIPPGKYTPIASSSPPGNYVSTSPPAVLRKPYTCLDPNCDSSFDHSYDRDRHEERQHGIGEPPYSQCPICRHSRSGGAAVDGGLRELLIAHMNRRHREQMESAQRKIYDEVARTSG
ncbi:MAG: hypothetical protein ASARMPRED_004000 [Alectoria sarmentosa]|nr:MAG: hypothetical protein ASARMPRED_004000 [Alectoria sarmentosa]